jgi:hypothetical protein
MDCRKLQEVTLPDSVTTIASTAFEGSGVTSLTGADCVFCNSLFIHRGTILRWFGSPQQVVIPSSVRVIEEGPFVLANSVVDLSFEEGVVSIGNSAFQGCTRLRSVAFPASLEVIGEIAFHSCSSLRHLTFPEGSQLRSIQRGAFASVPRKQLFFLQLSRKSIPMLSPTRSGG